MCYWQNLSFYPTSYITPHKGPYYDLTLGWGHFGYFEVCLPSLEKSNERVFFDDLGLILLIYWYIAIGYKLWPKRSRAWFQTKSLWYMSIPLSFYEENQLRDLRKRDYILILLCFAWVIESRLLKALALGEFFCSMINEGHVIRGKKPKNKPINTVGTLVNVAPYQPNWHFWRHCIEHIKLQLCILYTHQLFQQIDAHMIVLKSIWV